MALPPRFKKHAEYITIYMQCLNRHGKDVAVLGKQVLMLNEKKISKYTFNHKVTSMLTLPPSKLFTKYVHKD